MNNYITRESRLGNVFSKEHISELEKNLNDWDLPIIPYDITLDEMQILLAYQGNMLAYLQANLEAINMNIRKQEIKNQEIYNEVYNNISKQSADHKVSTLKVITENNERVKTVKNKLLDIQEGKAQVEARINALQEQNVSLRKIASLKGIAIQHGLE